ncbi:MAG: pilus assembly protein PilM, partial [Pseudomonas sp.]|nr:pilus assembly protein PilM [Pseudomonas sp.]
VANPFSQMTISPLVTPQALRCDAPMLLTACGLALRGFD